MKARALSLLAGVALLSSVGIASAAEPVTLDENQMDSVTAGVIILVPAAQLAFGPGGVVAGSAGFITLITPDSVTARTTILLPAAQLAFGPEGVVTGSAGFITLIF